MKPFTSDWKLNPCTGTQDQPKSTTKIAHLVSGLNYAQVLDVSCQKEFSEKVIDRKWIYIEKHSTERGSSQKLRVASKCDEVSFYGLGNFIEKSVCRPRSNS